MTNVIWSGVRNTYRIRFVDGESVTVKAGVPDAMRWESNNGGRNVMANLGVTTILTVIWYAMRRQHLSEETDFAVFAASVDDFGVETAEGDDDGGDGVLPDPTKPGQSDG